MGKMTRKVLNQGIDDWEDMTRSSIDSVRQHLDGLVGAGETIGRKKFQKELDQEAEFQFPYAYNGVTRQADGTFVMHLEPAEYNQYRTGILARFTLSEMQAIQDDINCLVDPDE